MEGSREPTGAAVSLDSALQEPVQDKLKEENAALVARLEQLERRKNEEMQNLKTALIAEQQVTDGLWEQIDNLLLLSCMDIICSYVNDSC